MKRPETNDGRFPAVRLILLVLVLLVQGVEPLLAHPGPDRCLPLWEVSHQGSTVYLMGSIHLLRPDVYPLDDELYRAFDEAEVAAFEVDLDELAAAGAVMMSRGTFDDGRTLREAISGDLYDEVLARVQGMDIPIAMFEAMRPWMAGMTLSAMELERGGYDVASGIDMHFHARAQEQGTETIGLETLDDQLRVFEELGPEAEEAFLRSTVEQLDETVEQLDRATEAWRMGDHHTLADMFVEAMGDQEVLLDRLLYARNQNWVEGIEELIRTPGTAIVIVGVGHLVGEGSVIELLEARGWEVRQVGQTMAGAAIPAGTC